MVLGLLGSSLSLTGCSSALWYAPVAEYQITIPSPDAGYVVVRAAYRRLPRNGVILTRYGSRDGRGDSARIADMRAVSNDLLEPNTAASIGAQPIQRWQSDVGLLGRLTIIYRVEMSEALLPIGSSMNGDQAVLLTSGLLVVPEDWLDNLRRPLNERVRVQVTPPAGWAVHSAWESDSEGTAFVPATVERLVDGVLVAGRLRSYGLMAAGLDVEIVTPKALPVERADACVEALGQEIERLYGLFDVAPDTSAIAHVMVTMIVDEAWEGYAEARGFGDRNVVVRTGDDLPIDMDLAVMRQVVGFWNGAAIRIPSPWGQDRADGRAALVAGINDYVAWTALYEMGRVGTIQYWNQVRGLTGLMAQDGGLGVFELEEMGTTLPSSNAVAWALRSRGHLFGVLLDQRLRRDTASTLDLAEALRRLNEVHNYYRSGETISWDEMLTFFSVLTGADYGDLYDDLVRLGDDASLNQVPQLAGALASETRAVMTPDGVRLAYQWLEGPSERVAIYLADGPGGTPYDWMVTQGDALRTYVDVAYLDQRGAGRSLLVPGCEVSLDAYVDDIETVRTDVGAEQVTLIGHAWGGHLALWYAARYPERVEALLLMAPITSYQGVAEAATEASGHISAYDALRPLSDGLDDLEEWNLLTESASEFQLYGSDMVGYAEVKAQAYQQLVMGSLLPVGLPLRNEAMLETLVARDDLFVLDPLAEIGEPAYRTLWLIGARDQLVTEGVVRPAQEAIGGEVRVIPDSGHYMYIDTPAATIKTMLTFLASP